MPACQETKSKGPGLQRASGQFASARTAARTDVSSVVQPLSEAASNKAGTANWTGCQLDYEI